MIRIERAGIPEPSELQAIRKLRQWSITSSETYFQVDSAVSGPAIRGALAKLFNGKCAFCESRISNVAEGNVAHYRPAEGALGIDGVYSSLHYRWLAYEWSNL